MNRKTVNIKKKELAQYISNTAKCLGLSESRFIERILEESMATSRSEYNDIPKMQEIATKLRSIVIGSDSKPIAYSNSLCQIRNTLTVDIPEVEINNSNVKLRIENLLSHAQMNAIRHEVTNGELHSLYHDIKRYTHTHLQNETHQKDKVCIIPLLFIHIDKITLQDTPIHEESLKKLKILHEEMLKKLQKEYPEEIADKIRKINEVHKEIESYIKELLKLTSFSLKIEYSGWFNVISLHEEINHQYGYFDFLNVKYKRYNDMKENSVNKSTTFLCLLKGKYGYLYCDILLSPQKTKSIIQEYNELKLQSKKNKYLNLIVKNDYVVNIINDYPRMKNESLLIREILSILNQKNKMLKNIPPSINLDDIIVNL